ncbi:hypothetical protein ACP87_02670 [Pseudomonas oleovorans]|nr:hypothetical protein [Pseudomonas oleovorans]MBN7133217.1 hypothetical protein [Pseudomonas oleovorans]MBN7142271.1 hypothetical protein [Pseudomonas oleovorans]
MRRTWIVIKTGKDVHQKARTRNAQGISQLSGQKAVLQICSAVTREPDQSGEFGHGDCMAWSLRMPDKHAPLLFSDYGRQTLQCLPVFVSAYRPDSPGRRNRRCAVHGRGQESTPLPLVLKLHTRSLKHADKPAAYQDA